jgi:hypothetical protein
VRDMEQTEMIDRQFEVLPAGNADAVLVEPCGPSTATFAARLSAFERRLQSALDRVPTPGRGLRVAATGHLVPPSVRNQEWSRGESTPDLQSAIR